MVLLMVVLTAMFFLIADQIISRVVRFILGAGQQVSG
jgi:preprotein translocase subunit SecE